MKIKKRDGRLEDFNISKFHRMVKEACDGLNGVSQSQVEMTSNVHFFDGMSSREIQKTLIDSAESLVSLETPNYTYVASRLMLYDLRKEVWGGPTEAPHLKDIISNNIENKSYDSQILDFYSEEELDKLNSIIKHDRDFQFASAGLRQVIDKYLLRNRVTGEHYETPQFMYIMIAATLFSQYPKETRMQYVKQYYDAISKWKISLPTPIMAGVRTNVRQFASCTLIDIDDTIDSILASNHALAKYISKKSGVGVNIGRLRAKHQPVRYGEMKHPGLTPFLKMVEANTKGVHQSVRGGSSTTFYPIWHRDIESLLVLKNNKGSDQNRVRALDYGVQISMLFMMRYIKGEDITLFSPDEVPELYEAYGTEAFDEMYEKYERKTSLKSKLKVPAADIINSMFRERTETGRIYIQFIDNVNQHTPFIDRIYMSNLCCVTGDTTVLVHDGDEDDAEFVEISDVVDRWKDGEKLWVKAYSHEEEASDFYEIKKAKLTRKDAEVVEISIEENVDFTIRCTPDHKIWHVEEEDWVEAADFNVGDFLLAENGETYTIADIDKLCETEDVFNITVDTVHNYFVWEGDDSVLIKNCEIDLATKPIYHIDDGTEKIIAKVNIEKLEKFKELQARLGYIETFGNKYDDIYTTVSQEVLYKPETHVPGYVYIPAEQVDFEKEPSAEIALCILSAINTGTVKIEEMEDICNLAVRGLDALIDYQEYPIKAAEISARNRRSLGIGLTNVAYFFAKNKVKFGSEESVALIDEYMEHMSYWCIKASADIAGELGPCNWYNRTKWAAGWMPQDTSKGKFIKGIDKKVHGKRLDWEFLRNHVKANGMRNTTLMAQMPAEASAVVQSATSGIEPVRNLLTVKESKTVTLKFLAPEHQKLKNFYTLAWDIDNMGLLSVYGAVQNWTDQGASVNLYYDPQRYDNNKIPLKQVARETFYAQQIGIKQFYYSNTSDKKAYSEEGALLTKEDIKVQAQENQQDDGPEEECESCSI